MKNIDINPLTDSDNSLEGEVERLRNQLKALEVERDLMAFVLDSIPDYASYVDAELVYRFCNKIYSAESGQPLEAFIGKHVVEFMGEQGLAKIQPHIARVLKGELVTYQSRVDYRYSPQQDVEVHYTPHKSADDTVTGFSVYVRNITAQRRAEEILLRQAQYDSLTDLPNRVLFNKRLEQTISRAKRIKGRIAVLFIDLDGFKQVNDKLGHDVGDQVLRDVASALTLHLRLDDTLARIGGDEFVLLVEDLQDESQVKSLASKVVDIVSTLDTPALQKERIGASVGIAFYPDHAENVRDILILADKAMYEAKRLGKNRYYLAGDKSLGVS